MQSVRFEAPWGKLLMVFTTIGVVTLGGAQLLLCIGPVAAEVPFSSVWAGLCGLVFVACAVCVVRGYRLEGDSLIIERFGWQRVISLDGLKSVHHDKGLMDGSVRVGNGGLFVFAGWFWSKKLGWFHLAGNDILGRPVLLDFGTRKWVVTPDDPAAFVAAVRQRLGLGEE